MARAAESARRWRRRVTGAFRAPRRAPLLQLAKSAVATVAAFALAGWLVPGPVPVFAAIAALLVVQPSANQSFAKAIERSIGVIAGVVVASVLGLWLGEAAWVILLAICAGLLLAWGLRMTTGTANQVAISSMLVLALGSATPGYAFDRVIETVIGAAVGILVNVLVVPPVEVAPAHRRVDALGEELAASLQRLATAMGLRQSDRDLTALMVQARLMRPMREASAEAIATATESLTANPRAGRHRAELASVRDLHERFGPIVIQVIGMTRAFCDHYDDTVPGDPAVRAIAEQLHRAAHDVRLAMQGERPGEEPVTEQMPALTTPLAVIAPPAHWILVGSMLEDLSRIHSALTDLVAAQRVAGADDFDRR